MLSPGTVLNERLGIFCSTIQWVSINTYNFNGLDNVDKIADESLGISWYCQYKMPLAIRICIMVSETICQSCQVTERKPEQYTADLGHTREWTPIYSVSPLRWRARWNNTPFLGSVYSNYWTRGFDVHRFFMVMMSAHRRFMGYIYPYHSGLLHCYCLWV